MDCSTLGLPAHHQFQEFTQIHVHWVGDAIQPSHSLSSPSHPLLLLPSIFPSIKVFSNESILHIRWPKYWSFSLSPSNEYSGLTSFRMDSLFKTNKFILKIKKKKKQKTKKERRCLQPWTWYREPGLKIFPQGTSPAPSAGTPKAKPGTPTGCRPSGSLSPSQHPSQAPFGTDFFVSCCLP